MNYNTTKDVYVTEFFLFWWTILLFIKWGYNNKCKREKWFFSKVYYKEGKGELLSHFHMFTRLDVSIDKTSSDDEMPL